MLQLTILYWFITLNEKQSKLQMKVSEERRTINHVHAFLH